MCASGNATRKVLGVFFAYVSPHVKKILNPVPFILYPYAVIARRLAFGNSVAQLTTGSRKQGTGCSKSERI